MTDSPADALRRAFPFGKAETLKAMIEGIANSKPRAARESAMAGARRRKRFKRTKKEE